MFFFDTIGIGLFTVLGIEKALSIGLSYTVSILMGVVSAVFGGVIRDVLCNEVPLIFRKEIYASACLLGGIFYILLFHYEVNENASMIISMIIVICIRYVAVRNSWTLNIKPRG